MSHRESGNDEFPPDSEAYDVEGDPIEEEAESALPSCSFCKAEIVDRFYEVGGLIVCEPCRAGVGAALGHQPGGTGRFARALFFGLLAGLGGFLIYYGVLALFDRQVGLIAILVGYMVGTGVAKGSRHRGGWVYQTLAIFLTYTVVSASFSAAILPRAIAGFMEKRKLEEAEKAAAKADPNAVGAEAEAAPAAPRPPATPLELVGAVFLLAGALLVLVYAFPIMAGMSSPVSFLIVGFALWEAWKLNRRPKIVFRGPFPVEASPGVAAG